LLSPDNHGHAAWVYQSSLGGGFVGGDDVCLDVEVERDATLFLSSQSSSKVYRAANSRFSLTARVGAEATLISWPDPLVCFAGAALTQRQSFALDASASLVCVDAYTAGRVANGERWAFERLSLRLSVQISSVPCFTDAQQLSPRQGALAERLAPFDAFATVVLAGPRLQRAADALHRDLVERPLGDGPLVVGSRWPWGLVLRVAGRSVEELLLAIRTRVRPLLPELLGDDPLERKW
jgi:urease accessory protein